MLDETLPYCEDVDWFFAAQAAGLQVARMPRVAIWYRRHDGNMTNRKDLIRRFTLQVVAKHRRRHGGETL